MPPERETFGRCWSKRALILLMIDGMQKMTQIKTAKTFSSKYDTPKILVQRVNIWILVVEFINRQSLVPKNVMINNPQPWS